MLLFCNTFDLHEAIISLENQFWSFESDRFTKVLLYRVSEELNTHADLSGRVMGINSGLNLHLLPYFV